METKAERKKLELLCLTQTLILLLNLSKVKILLDNEVKKNATHNISISLKGKIVALQFDPYEEHGFGFAAFQDKILPFLGIKLVFKGLQKPKQEFT